MAKRQYKGPKLEAVGDNRWRFEICVKGQRRKIYIDAATRKQAEALAPERKAKEVAKLKTTVASGSVNLTMHDALDAYFAYVYGPNPDKGGGPARDRSIIDWFKEQVDPDYLLIDLDQNAVERLIEVRRRQTRTKIVSRKGKGALKAGKRIQVPLANSTINQVVPKFLNRMFVYLEKRRGYKFPKKPNFADLHLPQNDKKEVELTKEMYAKILAAARPEDAPYIDLFDFACITGLRRQAQLLRWSDVTLRDDGTGVAMVRLKTRGPDKRREPVELSEAACNIIRKQRDDSGKPLHSKYVFTFICQQTHPKLGLVSGNRYPIRYDGLGVWWNRFKHRAGVPDLRWHDCRHVAGTWMLRLTGDVTLAQAQLNHRNIQTTMRYARTNPATVRAGLAKMADLPWAQRHLADRNDPDQPPPAAMRDRVVAMLGCQSAVAAVNDNEVGEWTTISKVQ